MNTLKSLLTSRKVLLALTALVVAVADKYGWKLDPNVLFGVIATLVAAILGIAVEDAAQKFNAAPKQDNLH